jgi:hypothetical protein
MRIRVKETVRKVSEIPAKRRPEDFELLIGLSAKEGMFLLWMQ